MSFIKSIFLAVMLCLSAAGAIAQDPQHQAEKDLTLAEAQLLARQKELLVVLELKKKAAAELDIAKADLEAAQKQVTAAQERLKQPVFLMRMASGKMTVIRNQTLTCDAMPFLRYTCNGAAGCEFPVDGAVCGFPGANTDAMELSVSYKCGDQTVSQHFGSNQKAYLTCK